jgi:excisionase family DNA binding protein
LHTATYLTIVESIHGRHHVLPVTDRLSTQEAAHELGVSKPTLLRWIKDGKVTDVKRDRNNWRVFTADDVRRIREQMELDA